MDMNMGKLQEMMGDGDAWRAAVHGVVKGWTSLGDGTTSERDIFLRVKAVNAQSCLTLCDPMDYRVHGNLQASGSG